MKVSFSTDGWGLSFDRYCALARESGFGGIELHDALTHFAGAEGALAAGRLGATARALMEQRLFVPCLSVSCDIADPSRTAQNIALIHQYIQLASRLRCPNVRLRAGTTADPGEHIEDETAIALLSSVLPAAEEAAVTLLIETVGPYADTARLFEVLNTFSSDSLGALWDLNHPYRYAQESPEQTVQHLGAAIRHIHAKDSIIGPDGVEYRLMGEGDLPLEDMFDALRSLDYSGFISFEWNPAWMPDLNDPEVLFAQYQSVISRFDREANRKRVLFSNKRGTGLFPFEKDTLIDLNFSQVLDRIVEEFPDQYAFRYTTLDYTRTYREFRDDVDRFARALIDLGVKAGDHVAIWATNVPQWYITFWATVKLGAVLVTVNTAYKIHEAEYLLRQSDTHTLVLTEGFRDSDYGAIVRELCPELENTQSGDNLHSRRLPFLRNVVTVGFTMPGCMTFEQAMARHSKVPPEELRRRSLAVDSDSVCNMQYTSGTTGFPKGVMLTHRNIVNNGKCIGDRMDLSTADRMMIHVPMFHCFGMVLAMTASMTHGTTLSPLPYFNQRASLACINQEKITCFHGVPTMFIAMLEHEDFVKTDFSHMRTGIMAGSPCPIAVMKDVVNKMHMDEITIVFGQTEASPGCTMSSADDSLEVRVGTVGRALPGIECKIVDPETGVDLPDDVTGEFVARGYNIMKGYYKMPKATRSAIDADGWLHTGDLACRTPEGNYRITGRLKDMIIRGGENIYPKEIEEFLYTHDKISDVQVIGVPDTQYGEQIMACVILKEGQSMTEDDVRQYVQSHMAHHKVPKYVAFLDAFPMNAAGKILKYRMREDAVERYGLQNVAKTPTA